MSKAALMPGPMKLISRCRILRRPELERYFLVTVTRQPVESLFISEIVCREGFNTVQPAAPFGLKLKL